MQALLLCLGWNALHGIVPVRSLGEDLHSLATTSESILHEESH